MSLLATAIVAILSNDIHSFIKTDVFGKNTHSLLYWYSKYFGQLVRSS